MSFLTDRKRALGTGAGRHGTHHHWQMMMTSVVLVVLLPLFIFTFAAGLGGTQEEVVAYFGRPFPALITALTLVVGMIHLKHETQAAIEDYMHGAAEKLAYIAASAFAYTVIAIGLFAIARMAL